jgi:tetratricopeptide (TPR) repeat protein
MTRGLLRSRRLVAAALVLADALVMSAAADEFADCKQAGDAPKAVARCTRVIESGALQGSDLAAAYRQRGAAYRRQGEFERSLADLSAAIRFDPKAAVGYANRAPILIDLGQRERAFADWNEAIRIYGEAIARDPANAQYFHSNRALIQLNKGEFERAVADYGDAVRLRPQEAFFPASRGRAYYLQGDLIKARADLTHALALPPAFPAAPAFPYALRGSVHAAAGALDAAVADYEEAIEVDPNAGLAYAGRARVHEARGERTRAAADFVTALQRDTSVVWTYVLHGIALEHGGKPDRALVEFETALKVEPKLASAIRGRDRVRAALDADAQRK